MAKTLEEILQTYFGCKVPFRKNGELTTTGKKAFTKLQNLLADLEELEVIESASKCMRVLDAIIDTYDGPEELREAIKYVQDNIDADDLAIVRAEANKCWNMHLVPTESTMDCDTITDLLGEYAEEHGLEERWWEQYAEIDEIICQL